jgi:hypothetical protein
MRLVFRNSRHGGKKKKKKEKKKEKYVESSEGNTNVCENIKNVIFIKLFKLQGVFLYLRPLQPSNLNS